MTARQDVKEEIGGCARCGSHQIRFSADDLRSGSRIRCPQCHQETEAFQVFFEGFNKRVLNICRARVHHPARAQELCQEVFLRVFANLSRLKPGQSLTPWVLRIANNVAIDDYRHHRRETALDQDIVAKLAKMNPGDVEPHDPLLVDKLLNCLKKLPAIDRMILLLDGEGFSHAEIAQRTDYSCSNVGTRKNRALEKLRECMRGT